MYDSINMKSWLGLLFDWFEQAVFCQLEETLHGVCILQYTIFLQKILNAPTLLIIIVKELPPIHIPNLPLPTTIPNLTVLLPKPNLQQIVPNRKLMLYLGHNLLQIFSQIDHIKISPVLTLIRTFQEPMPDDVVVEC